MLVTCSCEFDDRATRATRRVRTPSTDPSSCTTHAQGFAQLLEVLACSTHFTLELPISELDKRCQKNNEVTFVRVHIICNEIKWRLQQLQLSLPSQRFINSNPTRISCRIWECNKIDSFFTIFSFKCCWCKKNNIKKMSICVHFPC